MVFSGKTSKFRFWALFDLEKWDAFYSTHFWPNGVFVKIRPWCSESSIFLKAQAISAQSTKCIQKCLKSPFWGYMGLGVDFQWFWNYGRFWDSDGKKKCHFLKTHLRFSREFPSNKVPITHTNLVKPSLVPTGTATVIFIFCSSRVRDGLRILKRFPSRLDRPNQLEHR